MLKARVTVFPRREILDPQGKAIEGALGRLGFSGVESVRAGKSFDLQLATSDVEAARAALAEMCEKLLVNTVVEDYAIEIVDRDGEGGGEGGQG